MGAKVSACIWPYADVQYGYLDRELGYDHLHALAAEGRHKAVRKLLRHGMDPNARRLEGALGADDDERGDSAMICAARGILGNRDQKRHVKTLQVLVHFGAKINQSNLLNQTPLYIACERNVVRVATWLLEHGADVNINCKTGISPLMCAYQNQNAILVKMLLEKGAVVIRPPVTFSRIEFPELARELLDGGKASSNDKSASTLHSTLQQYIDREGERRTHLIEAANEAQRLEDQRIYREQLAKEGAKRKANRRRERLEAQQRRNLPPVKTTDTTEIECDYENTLPQHNNQTEGILLWEKKTVIPRPHSVAAERPQWIAKQIHCAQQSQNHRNESEHDVMNQCNQLYKSLEQERCRRISVRSIAMSTSRFDGHALACDLWPESDQERS